MRVLRPGGGGPLSRSVLPRTGSARWNRSDIEPTPGTVVLSPRTRAGDHPPGIGADRAPIRRGATRCRAARHGGRRSGGRPARGAGRRGRYGASPPGHWPQTSCGIRCPSSAISTSTTGTRRLAVLEPMVLAAGCPPQQLGPAPHVRSPRRDPVRDDDVLTPDVHRSGRSLGADDVSRPRSNQACAQGDPLLGGCPPSHNGGPRRRPGAASMSPPSAPADSVLESTATR